MDRRQGEDLPVRGFWEESQALLAALSAELFATAADIIATAVSHTDLASGRRQKRSPGPKTGARS